MEIAIIQFNPIVGALEKNSAEMFRLYEQACRNGADLVVFPEMAVTGYPIEDLAQSPIFVSSASETAIQLRNRIQDSGLSAGAIFGCLLGSDYAQMAGDSPRYEANPSNAIAVNAAILVDPVRRYRDQLGIVVKRELPNYGVFDEKRVFRTPRIDSLSSLRFRDHRLGIMICEDCWFDDVTNRMVETGADILIAINGSPFEIGKNVVRVRVGQDRQNQHVRNDSMRGATMLPFLYCNMVGGQDELVFDGGSFALSAAGLTQFPHWVSGGVMANIDLGWQPIGAVTLPEASSTGAIYRACVLGLRDYMTKQGFGSAVLGMSGGVDSGIVAAIAADALGADRVELVRLPSKFSSDGSLTDADDAAKRLGSPIRTIAIEGVVEALRVAYENAKGPDGRDYLPDGQWLTGVADENIQARARGNILMAISNQEGHLLLTTGNKSEVSVGYSTLYGDMAGGFNPIKDCYKTTVWDLCRWRNALSAEDLTQMGFLGRVGDVVPEAIIVKPPSAELRPDQQDSDSLPPYEVLDDILKKLIEQQMSLKQIIRLDGRDPATVLRVRQLLDRAEYKRRQAAPGIKITSKLHGRERRVPIVQAFSETLPERMDSD